MWRSDISFMSRVAPHPGARIETPPRAREGSPARPSLPIRERGSKRGGSAAVCAGSGGRSPSGSADRNRSKRAFRSRSAASLPIRERGSKRLDEFITTGAGPSLPIRERGSKRKSAGRPRRRRERRSPSGSADRNASIWLIVSTVARRSPSGSADRNTLEQARHYVLTESLPIRERGSKRDNRTGRRICRLHRVAPHPGARIETGTGPAGAEWARVAPHPGARIETGRR